MGESSPVLVCRGLRATVANPNHTDSLTLLGSEVLKPSRGQGWSPWGPTVRGHVPGPSLWRLLCPKDHRQDFKM